MTIHNALVIILLLIGLVPTYLSYRIINDQALLDRFLSSYEEISYPETSSCTLRGAGTAGQPLNWYISTGFAYYGEDRWLIGVSINSKPTLEEMQAYCETLLLVIDYLHNADNVAQPPNFPGSNEPIIRRYKGGQP